MTKQPREDVGNVTNNIDLIAAIKNIEVEEFRRSAILTLDTSMTIATENVSRKGKKFGDLPWQNILRAYFTGIIKAKDKNSEFKIRIESNNYETTAAALADLLVCAKTKVERACELKGRYAAATIRGFYYTTAAAPTANHACHESSLSFRRSFWSIPYSQWTRVGDPGQCSARRL
ncbi:hypothetical protein HDU90_006381 [Geranomyces variabilis]|nr:hypothetical protein HDU90_006381 [Geranomyces variabilis]